MTSEQVQEVIKEKVTQNFQGFARAFADVDYARIGVVSKDDFRQILVQYAFRLSDDQVRISRCLLQQSVHVKNASFPAVKSRYWSVSFSVQQPVEPAESERLREP